MKNTDKTLVLGLEHFIDKIGYQAFVYSKNNVPVKYLVSNKNGNSEYFAERYNADIEILPTSKIKAFFSYLKNIIVYKPTFVEIYVTGRMFLFYVIASFLLKKKILIILRGQELTHRAGKNKSTHYIRHKIGVALAHKYILKEENLIKLYLANGYDRNKYVEVFNSIPMPEQETIEQNREIDLLYLNSITKDRKVFFLVKVIEKVLQVKPQLNIILTGFNTLDNPIHSFDPEQENQIISYLKEKKLEEKIKIQGFTKDPRAYHSKAKIFLFPTDIVFLNYSLLESMSYGTVPIVSDGEGATRIVNEDNGYVLPLDEDLWVKTIIELLENRELLEKKSIQAKKTVEENFSIDTWFQKMMQARN